MPALPVNQNEHMKENFRKRLDTKPAWTMFALRQYLAEFFGTAFFIYCSTGAVVAIRAVTILPDPVSNLIIALAFGLSIAAMVYATANISGGHLNPAITIAFMATGNKNILKGVFYIIFQFLGAIIGSALLRATTPRSAWEPVHLGSTKLGTNMTVAMGFFFEAIITFGLVFTVMGTVLVDNAPTSMGRLAGLAIGFSVFMGHIVGAPFTGPAMNPARAFGPSCASGWFPSYHWIYWLAPICGALVAAFLYQFVLTPTADEPAPEKEQKKAEAKEDKQVDMEEKGLIDKSGRKNVSNDGKHGSTPKHGANHADTAYGDAYPTNSATNAHYLPNPV